MKGNNGVVTARTARLRGVLLAQSLVAREYGFVYWASRLTRKQRERSEGQTRPRGIEELEADIPPRTESPPPTPEDREEEEREAERQRSQKKRKGKMLAHLVQKKPGGKLRRIPERTEEEARRPEGTRERLPESTREQIRQ
ncbi:hypothetical protein AAHA92_25235 [Salvia divinorum]|uniref:Uncharacterized protein n=1 Tax=Salvia divinorum TaxID=28513 RepID=A0ABD1GD53_SALDI